MINSLKVPKDIAQSFDRYFEELGYKPPITHDKATVGAVKLKRLYRYRIGDWLIIYRLFKEKIMLE